MNDQQLRTLLEGRALKVVVIGASAGGVDALLHILPGLDQYCSCAVVVVLHVMQDRPNQLANLFQHRLPLVVYEARQGQALQAGTVYIAPPAHHLVVERDHTVSLSTAAPIYFVRPAIDVTMISAAAAYGAGVLGILMTGANQDGAQGMAAIGAAGGLTVVQDPAEAQVDTMPLEAIRLRRPDLVLTLADIRRLLHWLPRSAPSQYDKASAS
jgi:two-component system chemotaxis response regulator CheB